MQRDVQRAEAGAAQADVVAGALAFARAGARVAEFVGAVARAAAVEVAACVRDGAREALEVVVPQVRVHVAEAGDFVAEVAFGGAAAVGELVRGEA